MANVFGFEVETPQEVLARINARIDQMRASGDPNVVNAANSQAIISTLIGSPELRRAKATEKALSEAIQSVTKAEGESETDFQVRQNAEIRSKLASVNPQVALQANDNILKLQSEALQQRFLSARADTAEESARSAISTSVMMKTPTFFKSKNGQLTVASSLSPDATDEEINAELTRLQQADPEGRYVVGNGTDRLKIEDLGLSESGVELNKSSKIKIAEQISAADSTMFEMDRFLKKIQDSPRSLVTGAETLAQSGSLIEGGLRIAGDVLNVYTGRPLANSEADVRGDVGLVDSIIGSTPGFGERIRAAGVDSAVARGMILSLAYSLARTNDSGRLSDQDVEMAISMLTGSGSPQAMAALFEERLVALDRKMGSNEYLAMNGAINGEDGIKRWNRYQESKAKAFGSLEDFKNLLENGGLLAKNPSVFGKARQEQSTTPPVQQPLNPTMRFDPATNRLVPIQ